ncbi:MAG: UvrB/UvrC motif-containing protein, partial [Bacteroidia bacterium]
IKYNEEHGLKPMGLNKRKEDILGQSSVVSTRSNDKKPYIEELELDAVAADPVLQYLSDEQLLNLISENRRKMDKAAKELDFLEAARLRDEINQLEDRLSHHNK